MLHSIVISLHHRNRFIYQKNAYTNNNNNIEKIRNYDP